MANLKKSVQIGSLHLSNGYDHEGKEIVFLEFKNKEKQTIKSHIVTVDGKLTKEVLKYDKPNKHPLSEMISDMAKNLDINYYLYDYQNNQE